MQSGYIYIWFLIKKQHFIYIRKNSGYDYFEFKRKVPQGT